MPALGENGFNAENVEPTRSFSPIPAGKYRAVITASEFKPTRAGNGRFLELTIEILDGEFKARRVWSRLNLENPSQQAKAIAQSELSAICRAVGVMNPRQTEELHDLPMIVGIKLKKRSDNGELTNEVAGFGAVENYTPPENKPSDSAPWSTESKSEVPF